VKVAHHYEIYSELVFLSVRSDNVYVSFWKVEIIEIGTSHQIFI